jgi:hypothetical protein
MWFWPCNINNPVFKLLISWYQKLLWNRPSGCQILEDLTPTEFSRKVTLSLGLLSTPIPSFSGIHKVRKFYWIWVMKGWDTAFNTQSLRVITVTVQIRASENICNNSGGAEAVHFYGLNQSCSPRRKGVGVKTGWNLVNHKKIGALLSFFHPLWMLIMYFFAVFLWSHPVLDRTQRSGAVCSWLFGKL